MYQIWPCLTVGLVGNYTVAKPGGFPVFQNGAYHWSKAEAEAIAAKLNGV